MSPTTLLIGRPCHMKCSPLTRDGPSPHCDAMQQAHCDAMHEALCDAMQLAHCHTV